MKREMPLPLEVRLITKPVVGGGKITHTLALGFVKHQQSFDLSKKLEAILAGTRLRITHLGDNVEFQIVRAAGGVKLLHNGAPVQNKLPMADVASGITLVPKLKKGETEPAFEIFVRQLTGEEAKRSSLGIEEPESRYFRLSDLFKGYKPPK